MATARKGLANEVALGGKRVMMQLKLEAERKAEEASLCAAAPDAAKTPRRARASTPSCAAAPLSEALDAMRGIYHGSTLLAVGHALHEGSIEAAKADGERETEQIAQPAVHGEAAGEAARRCTAARAAAPPRRRRRRPPAARAAAKDYLQQMQLLTKTVNDLEGLAVSLESGTAASKSLR